MREWMVGFALVPALAAVVVCTGMGQRPSTPKAAPRHDALEVVQQAGQEAKEKAQLEREARQDAWGNPLPRRPQEDPNTPFPLEGGLGP